MGLAMMGCIFHGESGPEGPGPTVPNTWADDACYSIRSDSMHGHNILNMMGCNPLSWLLNPPAIKPPSLWGKNKTITKWLVASEQPEIYVEKPVELINPPLCQEKKKYKSKGEVIVPLWKCIVSMHRVRFGHGWVRSARIQNCSVKSCIRVSFKKSYDFWRFRMDHGTPL